MANYVDGFIIPVPKKNLSAYKKLALKAGKIWKEYGALEYIECVADDVKKGKITSFPRSVKLTSGPKASNGLGNNAIRWKTHDLWRI